MKHLHETLHRRRHDLLAAAIIALLACASFGRTLTQGFAPLDDDLLIVRNTASYGVTTENLRTAFTTFDPELYIPLTFVSYQLNYMTGGLDPTVYHATNILLHALNAILVAWVLTLLTRKKGFSIFAAMLFAAHPLHTETVAWLAGRKDLLFTAFFLAAWIAFLRSDKRPLLYAGSVLLHLLGLLSKVMAATLPVAMLLTEWLHHGKIRKKPLLRTLPFFALSAALIAVAIFGKERVIGNHSLYETALMACKSTVFYLAKFFAPVGLTVFYPFSGEISIASPAFFVPVLILLAVIGLSIWSLRYTRHVAFGVAFFLVTLAPTFINFHKGGEMYFASDRYPYLPSIGLLYLIIAGLNWLREAGYLRLSRNARMGIAAIPIVLLSLLSMRQATIWDEPRSLFENTLRLYPQSIAARTALASMDRQQGRYDRAIKLLRDGLGNGENLQLRMGLGTVYAKQGRVDEAQQEFEKAAALDPQNPEPLVAIGVLDEYRGNMNAAAENYRKAVELDPSYVSARNKLGTILLEQGKTDEAEAQFREALAWNPNAEGVLYNLSLILDEKNRRDEALGLLERANALLPDDPRIVTALAAHLPATEEDRAIELLERALRMDPQNADAKKLLQMLRK